MNLSRTRGQHEVLACDGIAETLSFKSISTLIHLTDAAVNLHPAPSVVDDRQLQALLRWLQSDAEATMEMVMKVDQAYPRHLDRVPLEADEKARATAEFLVAAQRWVQAALASRGRTVVRLANAEPDIIESFRRRS